MTRSRQSTEVAVSDPEKPGQSMLALITRLALDPAVDVVKLEKLLDMQERLEKRQAEAEFADALVDLALGAVLWPLRQPAPGEERVVADQGRQQDCQRQGGGTRRVLGEVPVHDVGRAEEKGAAEEEVPLYFHDPPPIECC